MASPLQDLRDTIVKTGVYTPWLFATNPTRRKLLQVLEKCTTYDVKTTEYATYRKRGIINGRFTSIELTNNEYARVVLVDTIEVDNRPLEEQEKMMFVNKGL